MILIPEQSKRQWTQTNTGDIFGVLNETKNMDFDQDGFAKLAYRSTAIVKGVTNFGHVKSISYLSGTSTDGYYIMTSDKIFRMNGLGDYTLTSVDDGSSHQGGIKFDGCIWKGRWYISQNTTFSAFSGATINDWNTGYGSLTSGNIHPLCVHEGLDYLAIGDGNAVKLYSSSSVSSYSLVQTLTLPANHEVHWMVYLNDFLYIGTKNISGGKASVFKWDGTSTGNNGSFPIDGNWVFSGCIYDSSVAILTSQGQILRFTGNGWQEIASLPVYSSVHPWYDGNGFAYGKCEARGMTARGNKIYLAIDGSLADGRLYLPQQKSGLWIFDPKVGLYHKAGSSLDSLYKITVNSVDTGTGILTASASYTAPTGTEIYCNAASATGISQGSFYYLINLSSTTFQIAKTYEDAINGTYIPITAFTSASFYTHDDLHFGTSDNGFTTISGMGALTLTNELSATSYGGSSGLQVIWGTGTMENDTGSGTTYTLQSLTTGMNRGYFTSQRMFPSGNSYSVEDTWQKIFAKFGNMGQSSDQITIKYRTTDKTNYPIFSDSYAIWLDVNSFSTTVDLSSVVVGEEVEFIDGRGTGCAAHILALQVSDGGYIVTLDEDIPGVSVGDKSVYSIQNWVKGKTGTMSDISNWVQSPMNETSQWIRVKIELRGQSHPFIQEAQIINKTFIPSA